MLKVHHNLILFQVSNKLDLKKVKWSLSRKKETELLIMLGLTKLFSSKLHKRYFLYVHKQIHAKVPISLFFVKLKRPSGNCYVNCFLCDKTALSRTLNYTIKNYLALGNLAKLMFWSILSFKNLQHLKVVFFLGFSGAR